MKYMQLIKYIKNKSTICFFLQNKKNLFQTDFFQPKISENKKHMLRIRKLVIKMIKLQNLNL
jgi:hypothetical protein